MLARSEVTFNCWVHMIATRCVRFGYQEIRAKVLIDCHYFIMSLEQSLRRLGLCQMGKFDWQLCGTNSSSLRDSKSSAKALCQKAKIVLGIGRKQIGFMESNLKK